MLINTHRKLIYLAAPKTGSTAVREVLREHGFRPGHLFRALPDGIVSAGGHKDHDVLAAPAPEGWSVAAPVRNHWDALVSWWSYRLPHRDLPAFDRRFIERNRHQMGAFWTDPHRLWGRFTEHADTILRFESLEQDLGTWVGESICLPRRNVSQRRDGKHYSSFYTPSLRDFVGDWFRDEIEELGYSFEEA